MKMWRRFIVICGFAAALVGTPGVVSADSLSVKGDQIRITAQILSKMYVTIDSDGNIQEIATNTSDKNAEIAVYVGQVKQGNEYQLTDELSKRISTALENKDVRPGIVYRRPLAVTAPRLNGVLSLLKPSSRQFGQLTAFVQQPVPS